MGHVTDLSVDVPLTASSDQSGLGIAEFRLPGPGEEDERDRQRAQKQPHQSPEAAIRGPRSRDQITDHHRGQRDDNEQDGHSVSMHGDRVSVWLRSSAGSGDEGRCATFQSGELPSEPPDPQFSFSACLGVLMTRRRGATDLLAAGPGGCRHHQTPVCPVRQSVAAARMPFRSSPLTVVSSTGFSRISCDTGQA